MDRQVLEQELEKHRRASFKLFDETYKVGGDTFSQKYRGDLETWIKTHGDDIKRRSGQARQVKSRNHWTTCKLKDSLKALHALG